MREACPIFKSWYNQNFKGKIFLAAIWVKHLANCSVYMHGIYKRTLGGWDTEVRPILKEKKKFFFLKKALEIQMTFLKVSQLQLINWSWNEPRLSLSKEQRPIR